MSWQDPRYSGDIYTPEELQEAHSNVGQAMRKLFGPGGPAADHFLLGGSGRSESNGMPTREMSPRESPAWRRMIEKARREIAEYQSEIRVRELAERITIDEIQNDIKEIRQWANSLNKIA